MYTITYVYCREEDMGLYTMYTGQGDPYTMYTITYVYCREEDMGLYTMYTGQGDPYNLATIASVDGKQTLGRFLKKDQSCFYKTMFCFVCPSISSHHLGFSLFLKSIKKQ